MKTFYTAEVTEIAFAFTFNHQFWFITFTSKKSEFIKFSARKFSSIKNGKFNFKKIKKN